ncbi:MAG: lysylphosphatidylglycerol synthase domain-containing protein [Solirubrobacteraceae bacterium]
MSLAEVEIEAVDGAEQGRRLRNGLITLALLVALVVGLLLAVPGLRSVERQVGQMDALWLGAAIAFELLSCLSYVATFSLVFDRAPRTLAAQVAWTEMAFGAAVSLGGAGSAAVGAWMLAERGAPVARVVERSAVLFLLTSAVNVIALAVFGVGLGVGVFAGPDDPLLSFLPGAIGVAAILLVLALPAFMERRASARRGGRLAVVLEGLAESIRDTARLLVTPDWRLLGAAGYLLFDVAVLWACLRATGHAPPIAAIALAYQIGYIANVIPVPGGIGVLDGSLIGTLVLYGVSATGAAAATVVYHGIALWIPAVIGTVAFLRLRRSAGEPIVLRPPRRERRRIRRRSR